MSSTEKTIVSDDGKFTAHVGAAIQTLKYKDQQVSVAVHTGHVDGLPVIIKVFVLLNKTTSKRAGREIAALKKLKDKMCKHAPEIIFDKQVKLEGIVPIIEHYVVMTKLPGEEIETVLERCADAEELERMKRLIEKAFGDAIRHVHRCGVDNGSHHDGNVLYHEFTNMCYIIDFERADSSYEGIRDIPKEFRHIEEWIPDW